jgi:L-alanine-DL-glutamate epimerase-like enolase superfamily enzyme
MEVLDRIDVGAYLIPTATPEPDGTLQRDSTTLVFVDVEAGGMRGLGYTKVGRDASADLERVRAVRHAIGPSPQLFVDANGADALRYAA